MNKPECVACYIRVSTQEQKLHGISLDAQRAKLRKYADEHNMKIVEWYEDEGISGRKLIKNRPELQRMIQDAQEKRFHRILFIKLDRFFRSVAEYHECMKRIAPVVWTTTDEDYDLTTANGRMLVNMKLTIAEMEADMTGERIRMVNEYKLTTGQPLTGSQPFGFKIVADDMTHRKKVVHDPETEPILHEAIQHYLTYQSRKNTLLYINTKYNVGLSYKALKALFKNPMLYGSLQGNPNYCVGYIDKETFDRLQTIAERNIKVLPVTDRHYIFSGLLVCPECGSRLRGTTSSGVVKGRRYIYKRYRCPQRHLNCRCTYNKSISENAFERLMLANIEKELEKEKIRAIKVTDKETVVIPKYDIDDINARIDRLNYSWQTGKIRTVEKYEAEYTKLIELLESAEAEKKAKPIKDFSHIEAILQGGWMTIYNHLDDEHRRAFWRSFVKSVDVDWNKQITRINFFE